MSSPLFEKIEEIQNQSTRDIIDQLKDNPETTMGVKETANQAAKLFENHDLKRHEIIYVFKKAL